jgi:hypothetical protein
MKTKLLFIVGLGFVPICAWGQAPQDNLYNSYGSSLGETSQLKNINVDQYTGTAKISFPLHEYSNPRSGLKHSIVIGYNAGGVKVDDAASDIGMNWSINLGGSIVRQIKGLPDEDAKGFSHLNAVPAGFATYDTVLAQAYLTDSLDGQFDIFSYNAGPASGKFIIGKNGDILAIPRNNVKIEKEDPVVQVPYCTSYQFKITLEDGTAYHFRTFNCDQVSYRSGSRSTSTEWFVTKIVAPYNQDSVLFNYTSFSTIQFKSGLSVLNFRQNPLPTDPFAPQQFCNYESMYDLGRNSWRPSSIQYTDGTVVDMVYDNVGRKDQYFSNALTAIDITNSGKTNGFNFYYNYAYRTFDDALNIEIPYPGNGHPYSNGTELEYSLQLAHFNKRSGQDTLPGYYFRYNAQALPPRLPSYGVDMWGYYNGVKTTDASGNPTERRYINGYRGNTIDHPGGVRLPKLKYAAAKSLDEIILPTGGTVKFIYELHTSSSMATENNYRIQSFDSIGGLRVKQLLYNDGTGQNNTRKKTFVYSNDNGSSSGVMVNSPIMYFNYADYQMQAGEALHHPFFRCNVSSLPSSRILGGLLVRAGTPLNHLIYTHGSPVGYGKVTAYDGTPDGFTRKTVSEFTTANDYSIPDALLENHEPFPYIPDLDFAWGLPKSVTSISAREEKLNQTTYVYDVFTKEYDNANFRALKMRLESYAPPQTVTDRFSSRFTHPISGKVFLKSITKTGYYNQGDPIAASTTYTYDTARNVLKSSQNLNAIGETIQAKYYYPFDFSLITGPIGQMKSAGMIYSPVRAESWNLTRDQLIDVKESDFVVVGQAVKVKSVYDFTPLQAVSSSAWGPFNPSQLLQGTQFLTKVSSKDIYDANGCLTQVTEKDQTNSIVWGYSNTAPIAMVTNAAAEDISYTSFERADDWNGWVSSDPQPTYTTGNAVTGERSFVIKGLQDIHRSNLDPNKKYVFTAWADHSGLGITVATPSGSVNVPLQKVASHRGWNLFRAEISNATAIYLGFGFSAHHVDELRLYPEGAAMTTSTYDPFAGVTSQCGPDSRPVYTEYDAFGRIKYKKDLDGNIIEVMDYADQEPQY